MDDYFARLRADTVAAADKAAPTSRAIGQKKVKFRLDRQYEPTSPVLAFDFLVELYNLYGKEIRPLKIGDECIAIETVFASGQDSFGRDFVGLTWNDTRYHELYSSFSVSRIYLHGFAHTANYASRFKLDRLGKPAIF